MPSHVSSHLHICPHHHVVVLTLRVRRSCTAASRLCFRKSSRTSVFSVCNTLPCAQARCFASSNALGDSSGTHHTHYGQDQSNASERRLRATPTNRWRSTEFRRTRVSRQQETQISNNNGTLLQHRWRITGSTRISSTIDGKTTIEASAVSCRIWSNSKANLRPQNSAGSGSTDVSEQLYRFWLHGYDIQDEHPRTPRKSFWQHLQSAAHT